MPDNFMTFPGCELWYSYDSGSNYSQMAGIKDFTKLPGGGKRNKIDITKVDQKLTISSVTGTTASSSATISSVSDTSQLAPGMVVLGTGVPAGSKILAITSNSIVLDQNCTASGSGVTLNFIAVDWGKRYRAGRKEPSTVEFKLEGDENNIALFAGFEGQLLTWKVKLSTGAYLTFQGFSDMEPEPQNDNDDLCWGCSIQISGNVTFHKVGT